MLPALILTAAANDIAVRADYWKSDRKSDSVTFSTSGELTIKGCSKIKYEKLFPVTDNSRYNLTFDVSGKNMHYRLWFDCLNENRKLITPANVLFRKYSATELVKPCKKGDTVIIVKPSRELWQVSPHDVVAFDAKEDLSDLPNFNISDPGITAVEQYGENYKITLSAPCKASFPAGTGVRLHGTRDLNEISLTVGDKEWEKKVIRNIMISQDYHPGKSGSLYPGTRFIRMRITTASEENEIKFRNFNLTKSRFVLKRLHNSVISERTPRYRLSPSTITVKPNGDILATYVDRGDIDAGCSSWNCISSDGGKTWSNPEIYFPPEDPSVWGHSTMTFITPDGKLLAAVTKSHFKRAVKNYMEDSAQNRLRDYCNLDIYISEDNGKSYKFVQRANRCLYRVITANAGNEIIELPNGDWILPLWAYDPVDKKEPAGSGFVRSTDKGKTWGVFEAAFPVDVKKMFNENAFAVAPDGKIIAYARIDVGPKINHFTHKVISADNGKTWSKPVPTEMRAMFPAITKLNNGIYVMIFGDKDVTLYNPYEPRIYLSSDGENWEDMGPVYYSLPEGWYGRIDSRFWGTGSSQSVMKASDNTFYCIFEGAHGGLMSAPNQHSERYIDFNSYQADFAE